MTEIDAESASRDALHGALDKMRPFYDNDAWNILLLDIAAAMAKAVGDNNFGCDGCDRDFWIEEVDGLEYEPLQYTAHDANGDVLVTFCWECNEKNRDAAMQAEREETES